MRAQNFGEEMNVYEARGESLKFLQFWSNLSTELSTTAKIARFSEPTKAQRLVHCHGLVDTISITGAQNIPKIEGYRLTKCHLDWRRARKFLKFH